MAFADLANEAERGRSYGRQGRIGDSRMGQVGSRVIEVEDETLAREHGGDDGCIIDAGEEKKKNPGIDAAPKPKINAGCRSAIPEAD